MTIDSKPSEGLPTNIFRNTSAEIQPKTDTKEARELYAQQAKNMANVVSRKPSNLFQRSRDK